MDIAKMDFDNGQSDTYQGVAKADRIMREGSGVNDDPICPTSMFLNRVDQDALVI
jgi:hypothetical protein